MTNSKKCCIIVSNDTLLSRRFMKKYSSFFEKTFLFKNICVADIDSMIDTVKIEEITYKKGETIYSPDRFEKKVCFIYKGECIVGRQVNGNIIPLNNASEYDSFGILTCFSDRDEFPTVVVAKNTCTALFIYSDALNELIEQNSKIALNIIGFLTQKINFLNDKIAAFSGGNIEEKLASYILTLKKKHNSIEFDFNKKKSAEALNCGRASLYRAIDALKSSGFITLEDKKIIITDLAGLERIVK